MATKTKNKKETVLERTMEEENLQEIDTEKLGTTLIFLKKSIVVPRSWAELTKEYLFGWIEAVRLGVSVEELCPFVLMYANNINETVKNITAKATKKDKEEVLSEIFRASEALTFLHGENGLSFGIINNIKGLFTPDAGLTNFTAIEFANCNEMFIQFSESGDVAKLNALCAVLLRATNKGVRLPYSESAEQYSLIKMKEISLLEKLAICKIYEGEYLRLIEDYKDIFSPEQDSSEPRNPLKFIRSMSGGIFGDFEKTSNTLIRLIFDEMRDKLKESENMKHELGE